MSDLDTRVIALETAEAVRIFHAIAKSRLRSRPDASASEDAQLAAQFDAAPEAEIATLSLLVLADDPAMRPILESMLENQPAESFVEPGTLAIGLGALVILQSYIKFERDKDGKWTFKFEKKPLSDTLLGQVVAKLGSWLKIS